MNIKAYDYEDSLDLGDFEVGGTDIITFDITKISASSIFRVNENNILIDTIQQAIDDNRNWYQLKLGLKGKTNNNIADAFGFYIHYIALNINYSE